MLVRITRTDSSKLSCREKMGCVEPMLENGEGMLSNCAPIGAKSATFIFESITENRSLYCLYLLPRGKGFF